MSKNLQTQKPHAEPEGCMVPGVPEYGNGELGTCPVGGKLRTKQFSKVDYLDTPVGPRTDT